MLLGKPGVITLQGPIRQQTSQKVASLTGLLVALRVSWKILLLRTPHWMLLSMLPSFLELCRIAMTVQLVLMASPTQTFELHSPGGTKS